MRIKAVVALCALAVAVLAVVASASAVGRAEPAGLWSTGYSPQQSQSDCGRWQLDANGFCVADDSGKGLEVGVTFQTSQQVQVTGLRIYRVETAELTTSLWDSNGTLLARGTAAAGPGNTWQDLSFAQPVTIVPGKKYVASYFTRSTKYAFQYGYFTNRAVTVGPVTALRAQGGEPNGVHCYAGQPCGPMPAQGHKDSNYWVTPLWQASGPGPNPTATPTPTAGPTPSVDREGPRVVSVAPANRTKRVRVSTRVKATFSEPIRRATLTRSTVRLVRQGSSRPVPTRLTFDDDRQRLVLKPRVALRPATTYRVVIETGVSDTAGNRLDQSRDKAGLQKVSWTFRTR
jgi:Domain of unknown function (DUF4082)/Bacterial Ig-like domain